MTGNIVKQESSPVLWEPPRTEKARQELQSVLLNSTFPGASTEMIGEVITYCAARQIDPLLKPVHIVPMWNSKQKRMNDTIMPGIYLYRILAARTGEYAGKTYPEWGPVRRENLGGQNVAYPEWCRMKVFRRIHGVTCEFGAEEWWLENYATRGKDSAAPNQMWAKRSRGQLAKCVEAQALRMAFPEAFGGTMTVEEMEGKTDAPTEEGKVIDVESSQSEASHQETNGQKAIRLAQEIEDRVTKCQSLAALEDMTKAEGYRRRMETIRNHAPQRADELQNFIRISVDAFNSHEASYEPIQEMPS